VILNNDDTKIEQYMNAMHRDTDVLLNCDTCKRLFFTDHAIALKRHNLKISILCNRCKKGEITNG